MQFVLSLLGAILLFVSCSTPNKYPHLKADPRVMIRHWTRSTFSGFHDAGVRGTEEATSAMYEQTLIFGTQNIGLISLYPISNQVRWVLDIPGGVRGDLTVADRGVYFGGSDGYFYCVDAETGQVKWRYEVRNPFVSKPTINAGRVFFNTSDNTVFALDAGTGKWIWHYKRRSSPQATIRSVSSPIVDGSEILVGLNDGFLAALNINDGILKWEVKLHTGRKFTDVDATPVILDDKVYVASYDQALYALKRQGGQTIWRFDSGGAKAIQWDEARIYYPSTDGTLYALKKESGAVIWKFPLDGGTPTNVILSGDQLVVASSFRYIYVVDKTTGQPQWRYDVGYDSGFSGGLAFDSEKKRVYAISGAGHLYAFELRNQNKKKFFLGSTDPYVFREF